MNVLDLAIWHALKGRQSNFAQGSELALRFDPAISVFAAIKQNDEASLNALADLVPEQASIVLLQPDIVPTPKNCQETFTGHGFQMVLTAETGLRPEVDFVELGAADAPEMLALAELTKPGPFLLGTPKLGGFVGIRREGRLAAMAGERIKPSGYTEISGVCTHPDFRGQGFAGTLSSTVARRILQRGETPFLHVISNNTSATKLYEKLGFEKRCEVHVKALRRKD